MTSLFGINMRSHFCLYVLYTRQYNVVVKAPYVTNELRYSQARDDNELSHVTMTRQAKND